MRSRFGKSKNENIGPNLGNDYVFSKMSSSPDQLAIVWNGKIDVVTALPVPSNVSGLYDIDISRLPADYNLAAVLKTRRNNYSSLPPITDKTLFLTVVSNYSERTRILALDGNVLSMDDYELTEWLLEAEQDFYIGTDNHPIFETSLDAMASTIRRLPNGQVSMTEVPRSEIQEIRQDIDGLLDENNGSFENNNQFHNLVVETPLRCAARYFLTALAEGENILRSEKSAEVTAFVVIGKEGFSYGLWSPISGLFNENAFIAPKEVSQNEFIYKKNTDNTPNAEFTNSIDIENQDAITQDSEVSDNPENDSYQSIVENYVKNAFDQLFLQLTQDKLDIFQLSNYAQIVWMTEPDFKEVIEPIALEYTENTGLEFFHVDIPVDEAIASGLLLGSFDFGEVKIVGAEILPPVNMARDILALADKEENERIQLEEFKLYKRRRKTVFTLFAAPVLMIACLLALVTDLVRQQVTLNIRDIKAQNRTEELKPALDRRKSYEANLKWYQEFIQQVSALRRQQPVGITMLYELNKSYPFNFDPSFFVSEMKLLPTGEVEIKGLARNKDAVTSFLRTLEFTSGPESGSKLFTNLTYEVQEGINLAVAQTNGQNTIPQITGSELTKNDLAPGVIAWNIKGNYQPMAEFIPKIPKPGTPVQPQQQQPQPPPATANTVVPPAADAANPNP